jgi:hypothetical protein
LKQWYLRLKERPATKAGLDVPQKKTPEVTDPKEQERIAKEASAWVMKGMQDDQK